MATTIDTSKIKQAVETIAEELGIDLSAYGNASPTKLIVTALQDAVQILQETTQIALTEQNPLTATDIHSRIGLAALTGLNVAQLLCASSGKIKVEVKGPKAKTAHVCTVGQHAKLISPNNIDYYVCLPSEVVKFDRDTELIVKQGILKNMNCICTGQAWESFRLNAENYVDVSSIEVYDGTKQLKVGMKLDEQADIYVRPAYDGTIELVISNQVQMQAGTSLQVIYADCLGIDGDDMEVGQYWNVSQFAYEGDEDISAEVGVYVSEPIIGGTDFENFDKNLANEIMLAGHNNLIGTESQLLQYVKRFKQYALQSVKVSSGVFAIYALRNLEILVKSMDYWTATSKDNLTLHDEDILSLSHHMNKYANKSLDMVVSVVSAEYEQCRVNVNVNMDEASFPAILDIVTEYLVEGYAYRKYEVATLYKKLIALSEVKECTVFFEGNLNAYGSAVPTNSEAILVCTAANITINGERRQYGDYMPTIQTPIDTTVDDVTTDRIITINQVNHG
jgi:hypothetical protein